MNLRGALMAEDDAYLSMIAMRQAKKAKNTLSDVSNLSLCMSYVIKCDTRAYTRLPLPLIKRCSQITRSNSEVI